jgi:hypothetical protein
MLDRSKMIGGFRNGEYSALSGQTYYGGSPAKIDTSGYLELCTSDVSGTSAFVGIFANSSLNDWGNRSTATTQLATVYTLPFAAVLTTGTKDTYADAYPYDTTLTWHAADNVYVGSDGKWTNVIPAANAICRGKVMAVTATSITVWFNR